MAKKKADDVAGAEDAAAEVENADEAPQLKVVALLCDHTINGQQCVCGSLISLDDPTLQQLKNSGVIDDADGAVEYLRSKNVEPFEPGLTAVAAAE